MVEESVGSGALRVDSGFRLLCNHEIDSFKIIRHFYDIKILIFSLNNLLASKENIFATTQDSQSRSKDMLIII